MSSKIRVVGLSGKMGTGKDFIARKYFFPMGYRQISLAWHFKVWVIGRGLATWEEVFVKKSDDVRSLLQRMGTERGRNIYGENIWIDTMFAWIKTYASYWNEYKFIVPDVRFPNEVEGIKNHGGLVYRIIAPQRNKNVKATKEQRNHPSEVSLDFYPLHNFDGLIFNDESEEEILDAQMKDIFLKYNESFYSKFR